MLETAPFGLEVEVAVAVAEGAGEEAIAVDETTVEVAAADPVLVAVAAIPVVCWTIDVVGSGPGVVVEAAPTGAKASAPITPLEAFSSPQVPVRPIDELQSS